MTAVPSALVGAATLLLLLGCSASAPGIDEGAATPPGGTDGGDSGQQTGVEGSATVEIEGTTYTFTDIPDDGFTSACRAFGASLQAILPADDGSGSTLFLYLLDPDEVDDPGNYDAPGFELQVADGGVWVAGGYTTAYIGANADDVPFAIIPDGRMASGTVTVGFIESDASVGGISRTAEATFSLECVTP